MNRALPVPAFSSGISSGVLTIKTAQVTLSYVVGAPFNASTLSVATVTGYNWHADARNDGNLLGTIKSLDELSVISLNCTEIANKTVHQESLHCAWGLASRDGWSIIDDTGAPVMDANDFWSASVVDVDDTDWYGLFHGLDFKGALSEYVQIGGRIAMTPRYASGIYFTRWYDYDSRAAREVVLKYRARSIPLDVLILDMNWHTKNAWGGYTVDGRLWQHPGDAFGAIKQLGVHMGANLHDDDGIGNWEATFDGACAAMGLDPSKTSKINFTMVNSTYLYDALEDTTLALVEAYGIDFWWIDWQQGGTQGGCTGLGMNPTIWLNHARATDAARRGQDARAFVLARWGGLGNHRYQVGFSGDVALVNWGNLAFQPYFTLTAANVGYSHWSHDLVGPGGGAGGEELYTRWVQWISWSAVFRSHDRGMSAGGCYSKNFPLVAGDCPVVQVWDVQNMYYEVAVASMRTREELLPYIYTAVRDAFDTGVTLLRPMYYEFPTFSRAYGADATGAFAQYFFGSADLFVAPVVVQSDATTMATTSVWLPPGQWYERDTAVVHTGAADGSSVLTKAYPLNEVPVFVRAGAMIPTLPLVDGDTVGVAMRQ